MDVLLTKASPKVKSNIENDDRSSPPEAFLEKGVLKLYSKFTGEHPCRSVISIKLLFKPFSKNTSGRLLLKVIKSFMKTKRKWGKCIRDNERLAKVLQKYFLFSEFSFTFTNHRTAGESGGYFFNSSLTLPHASGA